MMRVVLMLFAEDLCELLIKFFAAYDSSRQDCAIGGKEDFMGNSCDSIDTHRLGFVYLGKGDAQKSTST